MFVFFYRILILLTFIIFDDITFLALVLLISYIFIRSISDNFNSLGFEYYSLDIRTATTIGQVLLFVSLTETHFVRVVSTSATDTDDLRSDLLIFLTIGQFIILRNFIWAHLTWINSLLFWLLIIILGNFGFKVLYPLLFWLLSIPLNFW